MQLSGTKLAVWVGGSSPDASANTATYVVPQEWLKQKVGVEVDYRIMAGTQHQADVGL